MKTHKALVLAASMSMLAATATGQTVARKVESVDVQGADGSFVVKAVGAWGISCSSVAVSSVVFSPTSVPGGFNSMSASVLSAFMGDKNLRFYGSCSPTTPGVYNGTYVIISN